MSLFNYAKKIVGVSSTVKVLQKSKLSAEATALNSDALGRWKLVLDSNPSDVHAKVQILQISMATANYEEGSLMAGRLESEHPNSLPAMSILARWYQNQKDYNNARAKWSQVASAKPGSFESLINIAYIDIAEHRLDEALSKTDEILKAATADNKHKAHMVKARVYSIQGNLVEEVKAWEEAAKLTENNMPVDLNLVTGLYKSERYDEVLSTIDGYMEKYSDNEQFLSVKCDSLINSGKGQEALEILNEMHKTDDKSVETLFKIASLQVKLEKFNESEDTCKEILAIEPGHIKALTLFARIAQIKANAA